MHAGCGEWLVDEDFTGHDIPGVGNLATSGDACMELSLIHI